MGDRSVRRTESEMVRPERGRLPSITARGGNGDGPGSGSQPAALAGSSGQFPVGRRLPGGAARQRSYLTARRPGGRHWVLAVLVFDGVLSAIAGAFFLPLYIGAMPLPVSGL